MGYCVQYSAITHIGLRRKENQDNMVCNSFIAQEDCIASKIIYGKTDVKPKAVFGVFDGMGGEQCGGVASMLAAQNVEKIDIKHDVAEELFNYCIKANNDIYSYGVTNTLRDIGTTVAVLVFEPSVITLCNLGDTKIFRISQNRMEQISTDHAKQMPDGKRYLTQNLGAYKNPMTLEPYIAQGQYKNRDQYLICSDGLTDMVSQKEILQIMKANPFEDIVPLLLEMALVRGGKDNITIILCKVLYHLFG